MSKTLEERLNNMIITFEEIESSLGRHPGKLPNKVEESLRKILERRLDIEHCRTLIQNRDKVIQTLRGLETKVDLNGEVEILGKKIKFQNARHNEVNAYICASWALADKITDLVGLILCTTVTGNGSAKLVPQFIEIEKAKKTTAAFHHYSLWQSFGWPIAISFAIRNHFFHDGAYKNGCNFFDGPAFQISVGGWNHVEKEAMEKGVLSNYHRGGLDWLSSPRDDLRIVFSSCEREIDDALGILGGSACHTLKAHVGFMLGED